MPLPPGERSPRAGESRRQQAQRALPPSTSESALAHSARYGACRHTGTLNDSSKGPQVGATKPRGVKPFILRSRNAPPPPQSPPATQSSGSALSPGSTAKQEAGAMRKSKTSLDLERKAVAGSPPKPRKSLLGRRQNENIPPSTAQQGASNAGTAAPRRTRPPSLATTSLRALGKLAPSKSGSAGQAPQPARRRQLAYVVSPPSPPRTRALHPSNHSSPSGSQHADSPSSSPTKSRSTRTPRSLASSSAPESPPLLRSSRPTVRTSPPHAVKSQSRHAAVELHKSALKRKMLEGAAPTAAAASNEEGPGPARRPALRPMYSAGALLEGDRATRTAPPAVGTRSTGGLTRSQRWHGGEPTGVQDRAATVADRQIGEPEPTRDAFSTPPPAARRANDQLRKRASYAALAVDPHVRPAEGSGEQSTGYTSLQELLEQHGYADTRVITPQSTTQAARIHSAMKDDARIESLLRYGTTGDDQEEEEEELEVLASPLADRTAGRRPHSPGPTRMPAAPTLPAAESEAPRPKELKERPSLLSLRGLFSFFGTSAVDVEEDLATSPQRAEHEPGAAPPSPPVELEADAQPEPTPPRVQRMRPTSEMHRWVEGVNEVYPPPAPPAPFASVAASATAVTPELHFEPAVDIDDEEDAASSRSYSSSISFSGSPPTPQPMFGERDCTVILAGSSSGSHLSPSGPAAADEASADLPRNKHLSLRHTVSDSNLLPAYQSFAGLGIAAPSAPLTLQSQLAATRPPNPTAHSTGAVPTATASTAGLWGTSHLRHRASQLFSLALARSPVDAATGRSFFTSSPPSSDPAPLASTSLSHRASFASRAPAAARAPPRLLRKAVSSAGLVSAPQVRRTRVVTRASWESFGSLEAKVSLDERRRSGMGFGSAAEEEGEEAAGGGIGWGEDLLGRAWA